MKTLDPTFSASEVHPSSLPPLTNRNIAALRKIKLTSGDEETYSVPRLERELLKQRFDHQSYDPQFMNERARSSYINMLDI